MLNQVNQILSGDTLAKFIQPDFFVGWTYSIDYDTALVMTNDIWKAQVLGIPHNCFLLAATFNPEMFTSVVEDEKEIILLRVIGSAKLPLDDDMIKAKIDAFQQRTEMFGTGGSQDFDDITLNQLQFGGLECRVLGTFYVHEENLWLGSDLESFATASRMNVYRPHGVALENIVNYVDPIRLRSATRGC